MIGTICFNLCVKTAPVSGVLFVLSSWANRHKKFGEYISRVSMLNFSEIFPVVGTNYKRKARMYEAI